MANDKFRQLLDETYTWPDYYEFKFIIKIEHKELILEKLEGHTIQETPSKAGNYVSISSRKLILCTDEVIEVYEIVSQIKGVISL